MQIPDNALAEYIRQIGQMVHEPDDLHNRAILFATDLYKLGEAKQNQSQIDGTFDSDLTAYATSVADQAKRQLGELISAYRSKVLHPVFRLAWLGKYLAERSVQATATPKCKARSERLLHQLVQSSLLEKSIAIDFMRWGEFAGKELVREELELRNFYTLQVDIDTLLEETRLSLSALLEAYYSLRYRADTFQAYMRRQAIETLSERAEQQLNELITLR